jgi:hypothetical protein
MRFSTVMQRAGWERGENKITIYGKQVRGFFGWITDEATVFSPIGQLRRERCVAS